MVMASMNKHHANILGAVAALLVFAASLADANSFLHKIDKAQLPEDLGSLDVDILKEIESVLGSDHKETIEKRLSPLAAMLRPTLGALPRTDDGRYGHAAVSHALKRLFVKRHGWYVNGLHQDVGKENSALSALQDTVPDRLQSLFEVRLGSHGLTAHDVALLAATLENFVHREIVDRLRDAYAIERIDVNASNLTVSQVDRLLDTQMALYLLGHDDPIVTNARAGNRSTNLIAKINQEHPGFDQVRSFLREVREDRAGDLMSFAFADVAAIAERIGDSYGRWQNHECISLKRDLLAIQDDGTGRVSLSKFYGAALKGQWQFSESIRFLKQLGALDETNPQQPKVIIPNYVLAPSNCVGSSPYYNQCCINECEDLLEHLERELQAPTAEPERIVAIVAELSSATTSAENVLRPNLVQRLEEIAAKSDGKVPIYGRLFAQWMHHVYPRECPFPHLASTLAPQDSQKLSNEEAVATAEHMSAHISSAPETIETLSDSAECTPWSHHEEFYVAHTPKASSRATLAWIVPVIAALVSMARLLWTNLHRAEATGKPRKGNWDDHQHMGKQV